MTNHFDEVGWHDISSEASRRLTEYKRSTASKDRVSYMENHAYWCAWVARQNEAESRLANGDRS